MAPINAKAAMTAGVLTPTELQRFGSILLASIDDVKVRIIKLRLQSCLLDISD
jgi:hypothetical protein